MRRRPPGWLLLAMLPLVRLVATTIRFASALGLALAAFVVIAALAPACTTTTVYTLSPEAGAEEAQPDPGTPSLPGPPPCQPSCAGRICGDDGCGGSCGTCKSGEICSPNKGTCGKTCTPSCDGRVCGDDGCGGSCGRCQVGACVKGGCQCTKDADCGQGRLCLTDANGDHGCAATCDLFDPVGTCPQGAGGAGRACTELREDAVGRAFPVCGPMGTKLEGDPCTYDPSTGGDCAAGLGCIQPAPNATTVCMRYCDPTHACPKAGQSCISLANASGERLPFSVCGPAMGLCAPNPCTEPNRDACSVVTGADGEPTTACACNPGYTETDGACVEVCNKQCAGKTCGPDGCGGTCGTCGAGETCRPSGQCCAPQCSGKTCGPDGCGGRCGTCGAGQICDGSGTCASCAPQCAGKTCGPDGCGGSCGFCAVGTCNAGQCVCTPRCAGKNCGDDGCGGSCGACGVGRSCRLGLCTDTSSCSGQPCYGAFSEGGCCASAAYCVRGAGQTNSFCRSSCGKSGEGCRGAGDCCGPLTCFGNVCQ